MHITPHGVGESVGNGLVVTVKVIGSGVNVKVGVSVNTGVMVDEGVAEAMAVAEEVSVGVSEGDGVVVTR